MSRENGKNYPRTIESKNSYLRIRAPEHLDVALEGLIRKVLKEQPKMDDIYAFAADYFDMLLKIREKAGIRKISIQDICPQYNKEDANDMIKLASTFTKRKREFKPMSKTYRAVSLKYAERRQERKGSKTNEKDVKNAERFNIVLPIVNEHPELEDVKAIETPTTNEKAEAEEVDLDLAVHPKSQDGTEKIIEATEIILEEEDGIAMEKDTETIGDLNEIGNTLKAAENEIQSPEEKEIETVKVGDVSAILLGEIVDENQLDAKVENTKGTIPIVEEPQQESENLELNVKNGIIIEEITSVAEQEVNDKEANTEEIETKTEEIQETRETVAKDESTLQESEGEESAVEVSQNSKEDVIIFDENLTKEMQETEANNSSNANIEKNIEEWQEEKNGIDVIEEEKQHENLNHIVNKTEEQEDEPTIEPAAVYTIEDKANEKIALEGALDENQESEVYKIENSAEKDDDTIKKSPDTLPCTEHEDEGYEKKLAADDAIKEIPINDVELQDSMEEAKDVVEGPENYNIEETKALENSLSMELNSDDAVQNKEAVLTWKEEAEKEKSESEEFIDIEKQSEDLQNSNGVPTDINLTAEENTLNVQEITNEDQDTEQNVIGKADEENIIEHFNEDNNKEDPEGLKSIEPGAVAIAGGLGTAAALVHVRRELTSPESEEIIEKESTVEEEQLNSAEEVLQRGEPERKCLVHVEQVEKFLDSERQHSSYIKDAEELNVEILQEAKNAEAAHAKIMNNTIIGITTHTTPSENEVNDDGETLKKGQSKPGDETEEGDEQERDGSTTSDEIEFEISPMKNPEILIDSVKDTDETDIQKENIVKTRAFEANDSNEKNIGKDNIIVESDERTTLDLNQGKSEEQTTDENIENSETDSVMARLQVPEAMEEEYLERKMAPQQLQSEAREVIKQFGNETISADEEVAIIDCANVGNEIIQTEEIQKVELIEGEEDILQVHLTTTVETVQENGDSLHIQVTSKVEPTFEISVETKVESPILDEKMRLVRAAVIIQNGFRRFKKRKLTGEALDVPTEELDASTVSETELDLSMQKTFKDASTWDRGSSFSNSTMRMSKGQILNRSATRSLLETRSLDPNRKMTSLKTRSLSTIRYGVADFEVWNQLVKELEDAATKIQSKYRGYKTRKKLQRGNAIQSTTTTSEESSTIADSTEVIHRHTGEFHDSIVLPLLPR